jgi:hypothetical protein
VTVLTRESPVAVAENTNNRRVCAVTGIANPVVIPLLTAPRETTPVSAGANVTMVPGIAVKVLSGVVDSYNSAVIVIVEPTRANATVLLK